jgi:hypothetical protein
MPPAASDAPGMSQFVRGRRTAGRPDMPPPRKPAITPVPLPGAGQHPDAPPPPPEATAVALAAAAGIPEPHDPVSDGPLTAGEAAELAACEQAIRAQQLAYTWGVGKALHAISKGRLYRATNARFDTYVTERWDMSPARAYQFITTWPAARELAKSEIVAMARVNVGQILALGPVARDHGVPGVVMVYETVTETVAEVDGARVTARVLRKVADTLPPGPLDRGQVAEITRDYLTTPPPAVSPADLAAASTARAVAAVRDIAAVGDPQAIREAVAGIRRELDKIEQEIGDDDDA